MKKHGKERLIEKKVFITGGASGIGRAICTLFAQEGAQVFIADIDTNGGLETTRLITKGDGVANFQKTDVSNPQSVLESIQAANDKMGGIDILVNDAAAFVFGTVEQTSPEDWERVFGVNVLGTVHTVKEALPYLRDSLSPAIVNIASVSSFIAQPAFIPYNLSLIHI